MTLVLLLDRSIVSLFNVRLLPFRKRVQSYAFFLSPPNIFPFYALKHIRFNFV